MEFDKDKNVIGVEEKPEHPKSDYAITGLYFYPKGVSEKAKTLKPSKRGELEITDLNRLYLDDNILKAELLGEGYTWYDTGTFDSMMEAANMIKSMEVQGDRVISSPEEIAYNNKWLTAEELDKIADSMIKNSYGKYLKKIAKK